MKFPPAIRKFLPASLAFVCATVGALLLIPGSNSNADEVERVPVVVVTENLDRGVSTAEVMRHVEIRRLPVEAVIDGAFSDFSNLPSGVLASRHLPGQQLTMFSFAENRASAIGPGFVVTSVLLASEQWLGAVKVAGTEVTVYSIAKDSVGIVAAEAIVVDAPNVDEVNPSEDSVIALAVKRDSLPEVLKASALGRLWLVGG